MVLAVIWLPHIVGGSDSEIELSGNTGELEVSELLAEGYLKADHVVTVTEMVVDNPVDKPVSTTPILQGRTERQRQNAEYVRANLGDIFVLIADCESDLLQFNDDGTVVVSRTSDVGIMQINQVHWQTARDLGIDIYTLEGNVAFAAILKDSRGTDDWYMSSHCWKN